MSELRSEIQSLIDAIVIVDITPSARSSSALREKKNRFIRIARHENSWDTKYLISLTHEEFMCREVLALKAVEGL